MEHNNQRNPISTITRKTAQNSILKIGGKGNPLFLTCLNADAFEDQMFFLASQGYRCIAHDRRGHGRSSQPWQGNDMDTYADDLAAKNYPKTLFFFFFKKKRRINPAGTPIEVFDGFRKAVIANRAQFMKDLATVYFGADRPGANISEALLNSCWNQDMLTGFPAAYFAIKAFSETDTSEDLKQIDVPTLILHGDIDQIVPIANAYRSAKLIPNATLKKYPSAPHAIIATSKDQVNEDLLAFIRK